MLRGKQTWLQVLLGMTLWFTLDVSVWAADSWPVTVMGQDGSTTLHQAPKRVVALEFSFVDALTLVDVSPVGIADDQDPSRLLPAIRAKLGPWQSVGFRAQPSLEVIASLKPDLIIADWDRHGAIAKALRQIAPTLMLSSRRETYQRSLLAAQTIAALVGKEQQMEQRIAQHQQIMALQAQRLKGIDGTVQFAVVRENGFYLHAEDSFAAGVIRALGLTVPDTAASDKDVSRQISLEQLLAINPDYLIVGEYASPHLVDQWQTQPLWSMLTVAKKGRLLKVDGNRWARSRGLLAAEAMADDLVKGLRR